MPTYDMTSVANCIQTHLIRMVRWVWYQREANDCPSLLINHTKRAVARQFVRALLCLHLFADSPILRLINRPRISCRICQLRKQRLARFFSASFGERHNDHFNRQCEKSGSNCCNSGSETRTSHTNVCRSAPHNQIHRQLDLAYSHRRECQQWFRSTHQSTEALSRLDELFSQQTFEEELQRN